MSFLKSLKRPVFLYLTTLAISSQLFFAILFYMAESEVNPSVGNYFDSFYYTVSVMTSVGLGDLYPQTTWGRVISILMMLSGTVIFVSFTGVLAASIMQIESEHLNNVSSREEE